MELDCTIVNGLYFDEVTFDEVTENNLIKCYTKFTSTYNTIYFYSDGSYLNHTASKCVIFPKGKTTWKGFVPPCKFKDGDVISDALATCIFKREGRIKGTVDYYCGIHDDDFCVKDNKRNQDGHYGCIVDYRLATEEEKQKLFDAIKSNGYKWNAETKTLEKLIEPMFKVGDKVRLKSKPNYIYTIHCLTWDDNKKLAYKLLPKDDKHLILVSLDIQDDYELVPNKFDINTLVPFESRVLVRNANNKVWRPTIFGCYMKDKYEPFYVLGGTGWKQCIPYEGNEHLLGTTDDCDEYYKTWE